jgi:hypothetical protein
MNLKTSNVPCPKCGSPIPIAVDVGTCAACRLIVYPDGTSARLDGGYAPMISGIPTIHPHDWTEVEIGGEKIPVPAPGSYAPEVVAAGAAFVMQSDGGRGARAIAIVDPATAELVAVNPPVRSL